MKFAIVPKLAMIGCPFTPTTNERFFVKLTLRHFALIAQALWTNGVMDNH
jgi:hypothetical protein